MRAPLVILLWPLLLGGQPAPPPVNTDDDRLAVTLANSDPAQRARTVDQYAPRLNPAVMGMLDKLVRHAYDTGQLDRTEHVAQLLLEGARRIGDKPGESNGLRALGVIRWQRNRFDEAIRLFRERIALGESLGDAKAVYESLNNVGMVLATQLKYVEAIPYFEQCVQRARPAGDRSNLATCLLNAGNAHRGLGHAEEALDAIEHSLAVARELNDPLRLARAQVVHGSALQTWGEFERALESYREGLAYFDRAGVVQTAAATRQAIGDTLRQLGRYAEALQVLDAALEQARRHRTGGEPVVLGTLASVHAALGDTVKALELRSRALDVSLKEQGGRNAPTLLVNLAGDCRRAGRLDEAQRHYEKALATGPLVSHRASALLGLAWVARDRRQPAQALEYARQALVAAGEARLRSVLADAHAFIAQLQLEAREIPAARASIQQAVGTGWDGLAARQIWEVARVAGAIHEAAGDPTRALEAYSTAIRSAELERGQVPGDESDVRRFQQRRREPYDAKAELLIRQKDWPAALAAVGQAKARVLTDVLAHRRTDWTKVLTMEEARRERSLRLRLVSANRTQQNTDSTASRAALASARAQYESFRSSLYVAHPELRLQTGELPTVSGTRLAQLAGADTLILEYFLGAAKGHLFGISAVNGVPRIQYAALAAPPAVIAREAAEFRRALAGRDPGFRLLAQRLHGRLLGPARGWLAGKKTLVVLPHGALWQVPLQALADDDGRYVIESRTVHYAHSLAALDLLRQRRPGPAAAPLLAFSPGNPETDLQLTRLDSALRPGGGVEMLRGSGATEAAFKQRAAHYRYLHVASHGTVDERSPLYSHVQLTASPGDDGALEAWELMGMRLRAELLMLSACETGTGELDHGEGWIGLSWSGLMAGASNLVASQWKVDAAGTAELVAGFYGALEPRIHGRRGPPPAGALRQAALTLLAQPEFRHPFYWAGFSAIGAGL